MLELKATATTTYKYNDAYLVDITFDGETYGAWIYHKDYGIKDLMFGMPAKQQSFTAFISIVEANVADYIEDYAEHFEDK